MKYLAYAARPLVNDLASSLFFAALVVAGAGATVATLAAMALGFAHMALWTVLKKPIAPLQWASLGLVLAFGVAGLYLHDIRFLMAKPSVFYVILAVVTLKRGWMLRYMPPIAAGHGDGAMIAFGYVWSGLFALTAALNLAVAVWLPEHWPLYKATFPLGSKLVLFAITYASVRAVVKPKVIAAMRAQAA
ncbi:septation protein IspZ [Phenylobacterium sp.]|jgi:intracellular septation protein A|uniref:septation protein IspZ n=1 Tax=Phenylobacterium sp. TaxID=1871053 RepID=UPI002F952F71